MHHPPETSAPACPKRMVHGPCGGVHDDLSCELGGLLCPFAERTEPVRWSGPETTDVATSALVEASRAGPVVLTDLTVPPFDAATVERVTGILRGSADALLVGEHQDQPDFSPTHMARLVRDGGGTPWLTLTCRDRNRLVLAQELASLVPAGADGVLCVTGDGRRARGPEVPTPVFDLDGTRLAALASSYAVPAAVAESPGAAPRTLRPRRLLEKQRAGAQLAVLNHARSPADVELFVRAARAAGVTIPVLAAVAVYSDVRSAQVLVDLPGLELDGELARRVLDAPDPELAGIEAAVEQARLMLAIDGVAGVNLSGMASARGVVPAAMLKAEIGRRIRSRT